MIEMYPEIHRDLCVLALRFFGQMRPLKLLIESWPNYSQHMVSIKVPIQGLPRNDTNWINYIYNNSI
jgi:hypothetical protein